MTVDQLDPSTAVAEGGRIDCYAALAASGPVQRVTVTGFGEVWLVTGFEEVRRVLLDPRLLKGPNFTQQLALRLRPDLAPALYSHMLGAHPPDR